MINEREMTIEELEMMQGYYARMQDTYEADWEAADKTGALSEFSLGAIAAQANKCARLYGRVTRELHRRAKLA